MQTIVQGKEAVLAHLEAEARKRTGGQDGVYAVQIDDKGQMIVRIAGFTLFGDGTTLAAGQTLTCRSGILVDANPPLTQGFTGTIGGRNILDSLIADGGPKQAGCVGGSSDPPSMNFGV